MINTCMFSGGRTSGKMLWDLLQKHPNYRNEWITIFCNTGKEMNETLDFVHEVETRWQVPIVWLEYCRVPATVEIANVMPTERRKKNILKQVEAGETTHWFTIVNYDTAARNGEPFDELMTWMTALPNVAGRGCSAQLKIRTSFRYLFSIGHKEYSVAIGIRADESHRATEIKATIESFAKPYFPLIESGTTEAGVMNFWASQPFDLQLKQHQGNCDLCFLKAKWKRLSIMRAEPWRSKWWIDKENQFESKGAGRGARWIDGKSYAAMLELATLPELDFADKTEPDIPCSCAERGFEGGED